VPLDAQTAVAQNLGKPFAEVSVSEEDTAQAARSYRTACSISSSDNP
jgi:hypothetical protein